MFNFFPSFGRKTIQDFKKGDIDVLVCTDVLARGLDVKTIQTVVNYESSTRGGNIDNHTHRIGR